jgi:site-specific recombinase XerD
MNGGDKSTLKTMLGHSTYQMVDRYSGSVETQLMQKVHHYASPVDELHLF